MRPDRVAVYSYAHVPWMQAHHEAASIRATLPAPELKLELFAAAQSTRSSAPATGRSAWITSRCRRTSSRRARRAPARCIATSWATRRSRRADMVASACRRSATSQGAFAQNTKKLPAYYEALDAGRFPIERGYALTADDEIRRHVITELMCNFHLDVHGDRARFGIDVRRLLRRGAGGAHRTGLARRRRPGAGQRRCALDGARRAAGMFVRNICMIFDRYLRGAHRRAQTRIQPDGMITPRVVVVGGGITGLSRCVHAARRGATPRRATIADRARRRRRPRAATRRPLKPMAS